MAKWNFVVRDETDRTVRGFPALTGIRSGNRTRLVEGAVRAEVLRRTVANVQNAELSAEEAMRPAIEAVDWSRAKPSWLQGRDVGTAFARGPQAMLVRA